MARTISDEELQLKRRARRRLIGAIVLVAAIVVVLPMVLDSEPRQSGQAVSVQIPAPDSGAFSPKVAPPPAAPDSAAPKAALEQPPAVKEPQKTVAAPPPAKETPQAVSQKAPPRAAQAEPAKPVAAKPAAKPGGQYVVQVIALADADKAKKMQQAIAAAGIKSYTEVVKTAKGDVTRVRAGPYAARADADKAREQLKALGMNGNIITR